MYPTNKIANNIDKSCIMKAEFMENIIKNKLLKYEIYKLYD